MSDDLGGKPDDEHDAISDVHLSNTSLTETPSTRRTALGMTAAATAAILADRAIFAPGSARAEPEIVESINKTKTGKVVGLVEVSQLAVLAPAPSGGDDTEALSALGSKVTILLRPGTYKIESTYKLAAETRLLGWGRYATTISFVGAGNIEVTGAKTCIENVGITNTSSTVSNLISDVGHSDFALRGFTATVTRTLCRAGWGGERIDISDGQISGTGVTTSNLVFLFEAHTGSAIRDIAVSAYTASGAISVAAISLHGCKRTRVESVTVTGVQAPEGQNGAGIALEECSECQVVACDSSGNTGCDGLGVSAGCNAIAVVGGRFANNTAGSTNGDGIDCFGVVGLTIVGAQCTGNGQYGIEIFGKTGTATEDVVVQGGICAANGFGGIAVRGAINVAIGGQHIHHNTRAGIVVSDTSVKSSRITIDGNHIFDNDQMHAGETEPGGVYVGGTATYVVVAGNQIYDDGLGYEGKAAGEGQRYGISLQNTCNTGRVEGNVVYGNTESQITAASSTEPIVVVRNNPGYNPVGSVTTAVPASGTAIGPYHDDRTFYVTASAEGECSLAIEGGPTVTVGAKGLGTVRLPAGKKLTPTYAHAPTWLIERE
jgi:hypothetical protein